MERTTRRRALAASAGALATALGGCTGLLGGDGGGDPYRFAEDAPEAPEGPLVLPTVEAPGSPGGKVRVDPPGKTSVVEFFATWCQPCKPQMDALGTVRERFDPAQVSMVSVTQETDRDALREFWRANDGAWPMAIDTDSYATERYDVLGLPTTVVVAPDGEWTGYHRGTSDAATLTEEIRTANRRTATATTTTTTTGG